MGYWKGVLAINLRAGIGDMIYTEKERGGNGRGEERGAA